MCPRTYLALAYRPQHNSPGGNPDLYIRRNSLPTTGSYDKASVNQAIDYNHLHECRGDNSTYFIGVYSASSATRNTFER